MSLLNYQGHGVGLVGRKVMIRLLMIRQRRCLLSHHLTRAHQALRHHRRISQISMVLARPFRHLFALLTLHVRQCYWTQRSVFYSCSFLRSFAGASFKMIVTVYSRRMGGRHYWSFILSVISASSRRTYS